MQNHGLRVLLSEDISDPKMDNVKDSIDICSFNCRSFKLSLPVIHSICDKYDTVLLQEYWFLTTELGLFSQHQGARSVKNFFDSVASREQARLNILFAAACYTGGLSFSFVENPFMQDFLQAIRPRRRPLSAYRLLDVT